MDSIPVLQRSSQGERQPHLAGQLLRLELARKRLREASYSRRREGVWLWVAQGKSRSPLLPTRTPQWDVLWQQTWAFCSEPAREQQGLGRTLA